MGNLCCIIKIIPFSCFLIYLLNSALFFALCSHAVKRNYLQQGQVLKDGEILVSDGDGSFEFGFFSPENSSLRYVGIWYSKIPQDNVVWVANRDSPITGRNGTLSVGNDGNLRIFDGYGVKIWSSNATIGANLHDLSLHNDGNLEIWGFNNITGANNTCWQSFDHPTDTYLPDMKVKVPVNGNNTETRVFTSWSSVDNPMRGSYAMGVDMRAAPQFVIWEGLKRTWRSGHWTGLKFLGVPSMNAFYNYGFKLSNVDNFGNMYFTYSPVNLSISFKFKMTWDGFEKALIWPKGAKQWTLFQSQPLTLCDSYNKCGDYGYCNMNMNPICNCLEGFEPSELDQWKKGNWSCGCVRKTRLQCEMNSSTLTDTDDFLAIDRVKLPDFADLSGVTEDECRRDCLKNCSCMAYSYVTSIGCMVWGGDLIDIEQFSDGNTKLFIRVASSDVGSKLSGPKIAAIALSGLILLCILLFLLLRKYGSELKEFRTSGGKSGNNDGLTDRLKKVQGYSTDISGSQEILGDGSLGNSCDVSMYNYNLVASATNFFSEKNKLGQGGFGPVYKGILPGDQEIAVKMLSRKSGQGMEEFKNEIMLIAKLQHRNLVRILGFCIKGEEKMLLYEYMPNKSLDCFIFDPVKREQLDWMKRFRIIEGIARGLLYLHRDSRSRIIHRDLKASNILLDQDMNPKISDFGMARIFGGDQDEANTNRVVGTYGYMSPEYAMEGFFSERSDVYSFGVLLLEVITGHRNSRFQFGQHMNLIEYAWQLWSEGRVTELADASIGTACPNDELSRCVHIAMLCVQDSAVYRPTMSQVILWLETDSLLLPLPTQPTLKYTYSRGTIELDGDKDAHNIESSNNITITKLLGR